MFTRCLVFVLLAFPGMAIAQRGEPPLVAPTDPLPPAQQRAKFHLPPGFEIQLVAAEPDINKPINIAFDAKGRLWVSGSVEYPFPAKGKGRDKVWILEDAMSPVPPPPLNPLPANLDFPRIAERAIEDFKKAGMHVVKTSDPIKF